MWLLSLSMSQSVVAKTLKDNNIHMKKLKDKHIIKKEEKMRMGVLVTSNNSQYCLHVVIPLTTMNEEKE
jgi:hypothetical protein